MKEQPLRLELFLRRPEAARRELDAIQGMLNSGRKEGAKEEIRLAHKLKILHINH